MNHRLLRCFLDECKPIVDEVKGPALFKAFQTVSPEEAERIRGTDKDPSQNEDNLARFLDHAYRYYGVDL